MPRATEAFWVKLYFCADGNSSSTYFKIIDIFIDSASWKLQEYEDTHNVKGIKSNYKNRAVLQETHISNKWRKAFLYVMTNSWLLKCCKDMVQNPWQKLIAGEIFAPGILGILSSIPRIA